MKKIFVIDDHPIVRTGIVRLLEQSPHLEVVGDVSDVAGARAFLSENQPDLVLLDILLDKASGLDLLKEIRALYPGCQVLVLSMMDALTYAQRVLKAGARGFVAKAQASISKVMQSPLGKRSEFNGSPDRDSLIQMRNDFIQDYKEIMRESGETFFKPPHPSLSGKKDQQIKGGALQ